MIKFPPTKKSHPKKIVWKSIPKYSDGYGWIRQYLLELVDGNIYPLVN